MSQVAENKFFQIVAPAEGSRVRLLALLVVLAIWLAALIVLYFTTVRPRHEAPAEQGHAFASRALAIAAR